MEVAQGTQCIGGHAPFSRLTERGYGNQREVALSFPAAAHLKHISTPLQADGLSRRVYPFLGLAIVGLVSLHGFASVTTSLALAGAMGLGVALVLIPLAQIDKPARSGIITAIPVVGGFVLALHPLWADGAVYGVASSVVITVLGGALVLLRPPRRLPSPDASDRFHQQPGPERRQALAIAREVLLDVEQVGC